jgi:hypothetical protein
MLRQSWLSTAGNLADQCEALPEVIRTITQMTSDIVLRAPRDDAAAGGRHAAAPAI